MYRSVTNTEGISENVLQKESLRPIYILKAEICNTQGSCSGSNGNYRNIGSDFSN